MKRKLVASLLAAAMTMGMLSGSTMLTFADEAATEGDVQTVSADGAVVTATEQTKATDNDLVIALEGSVN